ncbi:MAG: hypothetical protein V4525_02890 [Pseudomonadota bacterium]
MTLPSFSRAWIQFASLIWQGHPTENFPELDQQWIIWLRQTGLESLQKVWLNPPSLPLQTQPTSPTLKKYSEDSICFELEGLVKLYKISPSGTSSNQAVLLVAPCSHQASIFDLNPEGSLTEALTSLGHEVYVLEWITPNALPSSASTTPIEPTNPYLVVPPLWVNYRNAIREILSWLHKALNNAASSSRLHIMGLCLGGVLAIDALTSEEPSPYSPASFPPIGSLTLLSTLLDYRTSSPLSCLHWPPLQNALKKTLSSLSWIPASTIYSFCSVLMPSHLTVPSALSLWSQQGLNVSAPFALELLEAFYIKNILINPTPSKSCSPLKRLNIPLYAVAGLNDRLAPIHSLFNGLHHCPKDLPIRLSIFESGHLKCFLPNTKIRGYQDNWHGESTKKWLSKAPAPHASTSWVDDWNHWIKIN